MPAVRKAKNAKPKFASEHSICPEEIAIRLLDIYFKEIARHGFKRSLSLDEVLKAYQYILSKLDGKAGRTK